MCLYQNLGKYIWQKRRNDLCKDADSQHAPDAADAVGDERAARIVQAWLAVQDIKHKISYTLYKERWDDICAIQKTSIGFPRCKDFPD